MLVLIEIDDAAPLGDPSALRGSEARCDRCRHWDRITLGIGHHCKKITGFVLGGSQTAQVNPDYAGRHASAHLATLGHHGCSMFQVLEGAVS